MRTGEALGPAAQDGYSYLLLLVLIAVIGIASAGAVSVGLSISRRHAEEELLVVGEAFRAALASYRSAGGAAAQDGPAELDHLLRDPRTAGLRRHLRRIAADPLTGQVDWGVVRSPNGGIVAVYSKAEGLPIKRAGFEAHQANFEHSGSYAQWLFGAPLTPATSPPVLPTGR